MVESGKSFNENICPFVSKLISSSNKEIESFVQVEIKMTIKVTSNEFIDLVFGNCMQILEFMKGWEFLHV